MAYTFCLVSELCPPSLKSYIDSFGDDMSAIASSSDARWSVHNLALGIIGLARQVNPECLQTAGPKLISLIKPCALVMATSEFFLGSGYFFKSKPLQLQMVREGGQVRVIPPANQPVLETQFQRDLREDPTMALSQVAVIWACFTASIALIEACEFDVIGKVAAQLGRFGCLGQATGEALKTGFFISGDIAYTSWCFILMCRQMQNVSQHWGDQDFNHREELVILTAKTTLFALEVLKLASVANGYAVPVMAIAAGGFGCWKFLINHHRAVQAKEEEKNMLRDARMQLRTAQGVVTQ
jgi:hypothetical protein